MANESRELEKSETHQPANRSEATAVVVPRADVIEREDSFVVLADVPGVDEQNVDIQVERNMLTIHAKATPPSVDGLRLVYQEYEATDYERQFTLSDEVDTNRIEATVKNGVLQIKLAKAERARPRKISVTAG
jgi:HSP20 family molecular chaperone IbpA